MVDVLLAPIDGFYDHNSYEAAAIDVSLFILIIGGFLGLVTKTGAIDAGIERVTARLKGREEMMIPYSWHCLQQGAPSMVWQRNLYLSMHY
ncbi:arginine/ornithine antiporter arcD [Vibrio ishigakensis]|uniref:Arginine/ornithine antiporter arcD n=1 Tax=Vibrio ishigakensis TaxID=1481914 RepID=A0A0B8QID8_9VIBR|nr:arginine/ornithine antiporter arcD [Vibrio ishigakensis]